jgi:hypothetical protein
MAGFQQKDLVATLRRLQDPPASGGGQKSAANVADFGNPPQTESAPVKAPKAQLRLLHLSRISQRYSVIFGFDKKTIGL